MEWCFFLNRQLILLEQTTQVSNLLNLINVKGSKLEFESIQR